MQMKLNMKLKLKYEIEYSQMNQKLQNAICTKVTRNDDCEKKNFISQRKYLDSPKSLLHEYV